MKRLEITVRLLAATLFLFLGIRQIGEIRDFADLTKPLTLDRLKEIVAKDRYNPHGWYLLGCVYAYDPTHESMENARSCLLKAVHYNPYYFKYWMELAQVLEFLGEREKAVRCVHTALLLNRSYSELHWRAGNFFLKCGRAEESARCFRKALEGDPSLAVPILEIASRMFGDRGRAVGEIIPNRSALLSAALGWAIGYEDPAAARIAWEKLSRLDEEVPAGVLSGYIRLLWKQGRFGESWEVWVRNARLLFPNLLPEGETVYNGGVELPLLNTGFDWCFPTSPHRTVDADFQNCYRGSYSLLMSFDGAENVSGALVGKAVLVPAPGKYYFHVALRIEGIGSDQGVYFLFRHTSPDGTTREVGRSRKYAEDLDWEILSMPVEVPTAGGLLEISLQRDRSVKLDPFFRGRIWLDDARLTTEDRP